MHHRDGRHPTHGLREGVARFVGVRTARLDAQQRSHRLQVVLHPVVNLADRGVLGDEFLLLMADLGHVAAEHDRSHTVAPFAQRDGAQRHLHAARLHVGTPGRPSADDDGQRLVDVLSLGGEDARGDLGERLALELVVEAHAVERRQRVGAGEGGDAVDVEADQAVGGARGSSARSGGSGEIGEFGRGDHAEQLVRAVVERDLLTRGRPCLAEIRVTRQDADGGDRLPLAGELPHDRDRAHTGGSLLEPVGGCRVDDAPALEGLAHLRAPLRPHAVAHDVAIEERRCAAGAGVRHGDEGIVLRRDPDHNVGEGQISEQLSVAGEPVQPLDVGLAGAPLGVDEFTQCRHPSSLGERSITASPEVACLAAGGPARDRNTSNLATGASCGLDEHRARPPRRRLHPAGETGASPERGTS
ncbi:hypothetical protein QE414_001312 [Microbacterium sp. SORGH_AS 344]|nr:hypothetical protein [Microbacterium sp. SORGH_AS_0344]